jgi:sulfatase modifying factor 1
MLPESCRWVLEEFEPEGDPRLLLGIARDLEQAGNLEGAASVYDRAFGIDPALEAVREGRGRVLDALAVREHGLTFRYVPAGPFLMGSRDGEADEQPLRPVWLRAYWLSEAPVSWGAYCALMGWEAPPTGGPAGSGDFVLFNNNKIRRQYCEDETTRAIGHHAHHPQSAGDVFGTPPRANPGAPWGYSTKPMVAVGWHEAEALAQRLSSPAVRYALPTEAQWEKAARGGLIGARYPWGDDAPTPERCDFDRFLEFSIKPMRTYAPNGYGLYAMAGCVWEWARDWYDREAYRHAEDRDPEGPAKGEEKVLRGGSWADCAEVLTVSYRMSLSVHGRDGEPAPYPTPTVGFRLCRVAGG